MPPLTTFTPEVSMQLDHYVYRLVDPRDGQTFYIGKGQGNRVFDHRLEQDEQADEESLTALGLNEKRRRLREIAAAGLDVVRIIHRHGLGKATAFEVEAALIDAYPGLTNLQSGHDAERGVRTDREIVTKYAAKEFTDHGHRLLLVSVSRTYETFIVTYDAARFAWRLKVSRAQRAQYVLAHDRGLVVGVFQASEWLPATLANFPRFPEAEPTRYGFVGCAASDEITEFYINHRIPARYTPQGAVNPVRYNFR